MTNDEQRALIKEMIERHTKEVTISKESARKYLIDNGFYTEDGELTERYGGKES